jgi:energy-coupling factor transport system substrate-specific component
MNADKLRAKDLINTAVFTVVFIVVILACSFTLGMMPLGYPFLVSAIGLIGGTVWTYMRVKSPKRFTILIQTVVMTLVLALFGTGWAQSLGILIGGIAAEIITSVGKYKNFTLTSVGYAAFCLFTHIGAFLICLLARDYYREFCIEGGMTSEWTDLFLSFMDWPVMLLTAALAVVCALVGMYVGKLALKKHFVKAGALR